MSFRSPISITSSGFDPERGLYVKDPCLEAIPPTLGACRPDLRRKLEPGDWNFTISGKIKGYDQYIFGGFQVAERITMQQAFDRFPHLRLHLRSDGQLGGNIVIDGSGKKHPLDQHDIDSFERRILSPYIVGGKSVLFTHSDEIERARKETMDILVELFGKNGGIPKDILGRGGRKLSEEQVKQLLRRLDAIRLKRVSIAVGSARRPIRPNPSLGQIHNLGLLK